MKASHTHPFSQSQCAQFIEAFALMVLRCPWDISSQSLLTMGKILMTSWLMGL